MRSLNALKYGVSFWLLILTSQLSFAQSDAVVVDKYETKLVISPTLENLNFREANNIFEAKFSYSAGFEYKYFLSPSIAFSTGIMYMNKGFRSQPSYVDPATGESVLRDGFFIISARYLGVPLRLYQHIRLTRKSHLLIFAGFQPGVLINQTFNGRRVAGDQNIQDPLFGSLGNDRSTIKFFRRMHYGLDLGIGFQQYIKSRIVFGIEPIYRRHLNEAIDEDANVISGTPTRLEGFGLDLKLGYYFDKQIDNRRKTF